jgi:hypothetical protein
VLVFLPKRKTLRPKDRGEERRASIILCMRRRILGKSLYHPLYEEEDTW